MKTAHRRKYLTVSIQIFTYDIENNLLAIKERKDDGHFAK